MERNMAHADSELAENHQRFNDDLLANDGDLAYARDQFPQIFHLLDHPALRRVFNEYNRRAVKARMLVRRIGVLAIVSGSIALLSTATEPLWSSVPHQEVISVTIELCGLVAAIIAGGGLWLGPWRERWINARFMAERLRQWHFQFLVRRGREIEESVATGDPEAITTFDQRRKKSFDDFLFQHEGKLSSRLDSLTDDPDFSTDWLHEHPSAFKPESRILPPIFEAYRKLRFRHQYDYATYKLSETKEGLLWDFLGWPIVRQKAVISSVVTFCFFAASLCSVAVILNGAFGFSHHAGPYLGSATLVIAIIGITLRATQEALGIGDEIERYRAYRGKTRRLLLEFEHTSDQTEKLRLMSEMEVVVVDEMRAFLRTHREASFSL